jgi:hypothetical protein
MRCGESKRALVLPTRGLIDAWTFAPANPTSRITQQAMPLGMNLWCYDNPPSDGQNVEIIVRDFAFVPPGASVDGGAARAERAVGHGGESGESRGLGALPPRTIMAPAGGSRVAQAAPPNRVAHQGVCE